MHDLILWCGFLGGWLLFAGPVYQAALELGDEEFDREELQVVLRLQVQRTPLPPVSPWWWLLPPVGYLLQKRRSKQERQEIMAIWTKEQLQAFVQLTNKATGWIFVAGGAVLLAVNETWNLTDHYGWPIAVFWMLVVAMIILCAGYTVARLRMTHHLLGVKHEPLRRMT